MNVKRYEKNGYMVLKITEDLGIRSKLSELRDIVAQYLERGTTHIAVSFTPNSFLNSEAVAVCIECVEQVRERGGRLAVVRPNEQILEILRITELSELVDIFNSDNDLQGP
jgi:anti-anti-sigma factor